MAAYCRQGISKDLWCYVLSNSSLNMITPTVNNKMLISELGGNSSFLKHHTSSETESTVQAFIKSNPLALQEIIEVMLMEI